MPVLLEFKIGQFLRDNPPSFYKCTSHRCLTAQGQDRNETGMGKLLNFINVYLLCQNNCLLI